MLNLTPYRNLLEEQLPLVSGGLEPVELYEPIGYILKLGGKRLRPILTLLAADAYGNADAAINQALAVEVFHNFTLVHDDIMDNAPLRRGKKTVHEKWDLNRAILSGDAMMIQAYDLLIRNQEDKAASLLKVFNKVALEVCEGQQYDVNFETGKNISQEDYLNMIRLKTSVLLGAALELGVVVANAPEADRKHLYDFGVKLGIAFQIKDDVLDVYGDPEKFGKQVGGDILANKKTLLMLHALEKAQGDDADELNSWLVRQDTPNKKVEAVTQLFTKLGAKDHATKVMDEYYKQAMTSLEKTSMTNDKKQGFIGFADWLMHRDY
jgi:geranylgeranyl diphosphate synthase type II